MRVSYLATLLALHAAASALGAQSNAGVEPGACYGFSFGNWTPPLDWRRAGHDSLTAGQRLPTAPGGRDWAADGAGAGGVARREELFLFPSWWPAGITIAFDAQPPTASDTVRGRATALVADGKAVAPVTTVRVWRVRCGNVHGAPSSSRDSTPDRLPPSRVHR